METIKKYSLKIWYDDCAENPWKDWDCMTPLFYNGGRDYGKQFYGLDISSLIDLIPKGKLNKNILELFNLDQDKNYPIIREDYNSKADFVLDSLSEHVGETIENMETLASFLKLPYYSWTSLGYNQGDRIDCILVVTPEHATKIGRDINTITRDELKKESKTFDAYAWGDVYGFSIIEHKPLYREDGTLSEETEDEIIDSCGGFYGDIKQMLDYIPEEYHNLFEDAKENISY